MAILDEADRDLDAYVFTQNNELLLLSSCSEVDLVCFLQYVCKGGDHYSVVLPMVEALVY